MFRGPLVSAVVALGWLSAAAAASAQSRPTSGDMSLISGRTVGNGEVVLAGALGWPGFSAEAMFAPTSRFNLGVRLDVNYGALAGIGIGIGGGLSVPMRLHLYGSGHIDVAAFARPFILLGEGSQVGEGGAFSDSFGWGGGLEAGLRLGFQPSDTVTLAAGAGGLFAVVGVPDTSRGAKVLGGPAGMLGLEILMSSSTMLFIEAWGGYVFRPTNRFDGPAYLRLALGLAFRL